MVKTQLIQIIKRKIKITNYIISCLLTIAIFVTCSCLGNFSSAEQNVATTWGFILVILFLSLIPFLVFMSINIVMSSLKKMASYIEEKGRWRTSTIFLGVWQLLISLFVLGLTFYLSYFIVKEILWNLPKGFEEISPTVIDLAKKYLNGVDNLIQFRVFIVTISFTLLWCFVGFSYEIIKKTFRGNYIPVIMEDTTQNTIN